MQKVKKAQNVKDIYCVSPPVIIDRENNWVLYQCQLPDYEMLPLYLIVHNNKVVCGIMNKMYLAVIERDNTHDVEKIGKLSPKATISGISTTIQYYNAKKTPPNPHLDFSYKTQSWAASLLPKKIWDYLKAHKIIL